MAEAAGHVYALLADGSTVEIRPAGPGDFDSVRAMHAAMSPDNLYLRFFNLSKVAAEIEARRLCRDPRPGHAALLALAGGEVVGCASYDAGESGAAVPSVAVPGVAEVAFAVADHMHHRGIATLLLEHLVSSARGDAVTIFTAETLSENNAMLKVFADAGLPVQRRYADGVMEMTFPIPGDDGSTALEVYLNAVAERERRAAGASLRHVLAPESVVVIGASRERGTVGRAILDNIRAGGYAGRLYAVNARARQIGGQPCLPSVRDLPEPADLAVIAVPAGAVLYAAEQCGQRGVRTARRVGASLPVLAVQAGRSADALFEQAGVIAVPSFGDLVEATAMLASQPVPAGRTVAIVSNVGGAGGLAADACTGFGLTVHHPDGPAGRLLREVLPAGGTVGGPVDTTATVSGESFRRCLELLAADEAVDVIIAVVLPTGATGDLLTAIQQASVPVPLAAVVLDQAEAVRLLPRLGADGPGGQIPAYGYPEAAAAAVARAARYGAWRAGPRGRVPSFPDVRTDDAHALVHEFFRATVGGGWMPPEVAAELLRCYGIPLADFTAPGGTEVVVRVEDDHVFGPLVVFGLGGAAAEVLADRAARLTPLTDVDAEQLIHSIRAAPLLLGQHGSAGVDVGALRDLLLRVSRLADDLPEVTELDLNPVIARADGAFVADAQIRATPYRPQDPFLRRLR